ncbi:UDP-N-acetylglucosamine--N-acetylmuramyl-(pentapeptide) pyrophosphoryl-undecaprenol N-acetylglucosamine transferase [Frigoribacterium sp. ACAM 257]|uniref:UDP-N-acetylglucosamine--N-acetylmuramyl- (pentapeptide) pyrophosphoryl-undecaprenol N-acetylglucosamine transferase n=1 Tax=Frigoribacterium sp. ACAM 257 TaxID=2508998 RepID=UPI0011B95AFA|nr:UDP-N-acetylglucosamine--N-acetylmuramyl-(pentapeptide) pyrophosphoryl-undecaprenol N-acetylglucosamine transferase [Frigoribacterium sp. ACAM 257]TWX40002.1 UDP-N-acetylglucosamine--N-acetylmuramyl-(pentapeptide) pyrophosphoryl-undecaprenol N-acetylglucosamine transferase [Frigoribacterium sp. ACAM 257]
MTTTTSRRTRSARPVDRLRVVVAAGGTGGHVFPGIAVAAALQRQAPEAVVTFAGTADRLEATLVPAAGYELDTTPMVAFPRRPGLSALMFPARFVRCVLVARRQLRRRRAQVVVGVGGYPSVPAVVAGWSLGLPVVVHESNAAPGLANRLAARLSGRVACAFDPASAGLAGGAEVRRVGIPILPALAACDRESLRGPTRASWGVDDDELLVVVSGGSLGAASLDRAAVELACTSAARAAEGGVEKVGALLGRRLRLVVKASPAHVASLRRALAQGGGDRVAEVVEHIDDMAAAYSAADVVVVRGGACTVAEVEHLGVPAVVVPLPGATDDHQTANAEALAASGRAPVVVVRDGDLDGETLAASLTRAVELAEVAPAAPPARPAGPSPHAGAADAVAGWVIELAPPACRVASAASPSGTSSIGTSSIGTSSIRASSFSTSTSTSSTEGTTS